MNAFSDVREGNLDIQISYSGNDEFHSLYSSFNNMLARLKTSISEVYEQKILKQRAELKYLQSNINPHFLYNCFFTINSMALLEDYEKIPQITNELGKYYQYITSHTEEVTFEKEYSNAKAYLAIQALRFGEDRTSSKVMQLSEDISKLIVPSIILQPILENAFKHGVQKKGVISEICMDVAYEDNVLKITIENSPGDMDEIKLKELKRYLESSDNREEVSGILNVHRRIQIKYGLDSGLVLSTGRLGGLVVRIVINYGRNGGDKYVQIADS
jgi:two-component system sensor histidine kinase YesM